MTRSISQVSVIAGGWSFREVPHRRVPGYTIAVNDSAIHLKLTPNEIVSMDRLWTEHRWEWLRQHRILTHVRRSCVKNILTPVRKEECWLNIFECDHESVVFSDDEYGPLAFTPYPGRLNGTNSGTCALHRAWLLRPTELFLFGFDMQPGPHGEQHWHPPYPWANEWNTTKKKFRAWAQEFDIVADAFAAIGTKVFNVSQRSQIGVFPTLHWEQLPMLSSNVPKIEQAAARP